MKFDGLNKQRYEDQIFIYNGKSSLDFGIRCKLNETFRSPEKDITTIEVPGRNGTLTIDNKRFHNVEISYTAGWITQNFKNNFEAFKNFMLSSPGYHRLEDSYHPDYYRLARYTGPIEPDVFLDRAGGFDINFDCDPRCFLKEGEAPILLSDPAGLNEIVLYNPTEYDAKPMLFISVNFAAGAHVLNVNGTEIRINTNLSTSITLDFETENAYNQDGESVNEYIEISGYDYPALKPGKNIITPGWQTTYIGEITPRWWKI